MYDSSRSSDLNSSHPMEFNSIPPLFSTIVTLYALTLIYAPSCFLRIVLSPVLNSTGIILLFLLKLGAKERSGKESCPQESRILDLNANEKVENESGYLEPRVLHHEDEHYKHLELEHDLGMESNSQDDYYIWELLDLHSIESSQVVEEGEPRMEMDSKQVDTTTEFLKWNMKAPLEIIYEADEGEEEDNNENNKISSDIYVSGLERYPSSLMYYPESETDSSSDDDFSMERHESVLFKWEEEDDDKEELIEISVDRYEKRSVNFSRAEEDNLIEIDIFPTKN